MAGHWYVARNGKPHGPYAEHEFVALVSSGALAPSDFICRAGGERWVQASSLFFKGPTDAERSQGAPPKVAEEANPKAEWKPKAYVSAACILAVLIHVLVTEPGAAPYRIGMGLIGVAFGALGALLGFGASRLIPRHPAKAVISLGAALGFVAVQVTELSTHFVGDQLYPAAVKPKVDRAVFEKGILANSQARWLSTFKERYPTAYENYLSEALESAEQGNAAELTMDKLKRKYIEPLYIKNLPYLPDASLVKFVKLSADLMEAFSTTAPMLCVRSLRGEPLGDIRAHLSPQLQARDLNLLDETMAVDPTLDRTMLAAAKADTLLKRVRGALQARHGKKAQLLEPAKATPTPETCRVLSAFFREIAALRTVQSAALMRHLLTEPHPQNN